MLKKLFGAFGYYCFSVGLAMLNLRVIQYLCHQSTPFAKPIVDLIQRTSIFQFSASRKSTKRVLGASKVVVEGIYMSVMHMQVSEKKHMNKETLSTWL